MCPQRIFGLAIVALVTLGGRVAAYTNQWAVHIEGGPEVAQQVAREHGFQYLDKVSANVTSLKQLARLCVNNVRCRQVKHATNNSIDKPNEPLQPQEFNLQEIIPQVRQRCQSLDSVQQHIFPLFVNLCADIPKGPAHLKHLTNLQAINCVRERHTKRCSKRELNEYKQSDKSSSEESPTQSNQACSETRHCSTAQASRNDCRDNIKDSNDEYYESIQKDGPSYPNKPERYGDQQTSEQHSDNAREVDRGDCEKVAQEHKQSDIKECHDAHQPPPSQVKSYEYEKQYEKYPPDTTFGSGQTKSKMRQMISSIQKHGAKSLKTYRPKRFTQTKQSEPGTGSCQTLTPSHSSSHPDETEAKADPPPPKSVHWSESKQMHRSYRRRCPRSSSSDSIVFVPYQKSVKNKEKRKEVFKPLSPKTWRRDSSSSSKYPPKCASHRQCGNSRGKRASNERCPTPQPKIKRMTSVNDIQKKCSNISLTKTGTRIEAGRPDHKSSSYACPEKSCKEVCPKEKDKVNTSTLKCQLSRCAEDMGTMQTDDNCTPITELKPLRKPRASYSVRRENRFFKSSQKWKKQKYLIRLKVFKTKHSLDPCLPLIMEVRRGNRCYIEDVKMPRFSTVHLEIAKSLKYQCPPKYCPNVDVRKYKMAREMRGRV